jgi:type IV pilus assembly protein PilC
MSKYHYQARTQTGRLEKGVIEASDADEAVSLLQNRNLLVVSIKEAHTASTPSSVRATPHRTQRLHQRVTEADLVVFARSLAAMTEAGLPLLQALETTERQTKSRTLYTVIGQMVKEIQGGSTFRDAIAKHPALFPPIWVALIETGEASGQLTKTLEQLAIYLEKSGATKRKVVSALIYPSILLLVAVIAVLVFTMVILPKIGELYASLGTKLTLPLLTQVVLDISQFLRQYFFLLAAGIAVWIVALRVYIHTDQGRLRWDRLKLHLPLFGPLILQATTERFASNLSVLLRSGVPLLHALNIAIVTCDNKIIALTIEQLRDSVKEGKPLAESLLTQGETFSPMAAQMLAVGEQTGRLPAMLEEVAKYYGEQVDTAIQRLTALLEPAMLIGMAVVIGTLLLAMYLPIFQLTQAVR